MNTPSQANPLLQVTFLSSIGGGSVRFGETISTKYTVTLVVLSPRVPQNLLYEVKPGELIDFAARARKEWCEAQGLSPECQSFITEYDLANELALATELVKTIFPTRVAISFTLENDPESPDSWVGIRVATPGTISDLLDAESRFSAKWVSGTLPSKRYLIRLSLDAV